MAGTQTQPPPEGGTSTSGPRIPLNEQQFSNPLPSSFAAWGLPPDVAAQVQQMISSGASTEEILAYIRGTEWYGKTYVGIQQGISLGLIGNEADYRSYLNQANQLYRRFYGRDITTDELVGFLTSGVSLSSINEELQTGALFKTMTGQDVGPSELAGLLSSGIDPAERLQIAAQFKQLFGRDATPDELAQFLSSGQSLSYLKGAQELFQQYQGRGISPTELSNLLSSGTSLDTLSKQFEGGAYAGAYGNDLRSVSAAYGDGKLSEAQLKAYSEQKSGLTTPLGFKVQRALEQAMQRMQGVFQGSMATQAGLGLTRNGLGSGAPAPPDTGA
jgi:hypothetical protein